MTSQPLGLSGPFGGPLQRRARHVRDAETRLTALTRHHYPDVNERVGVLLAWAGIAARESTGGLKWYDLAVQRQLLAEPAERILTALTTRAPSSPAQLDGAAQLFGSLEWTTAHGKDVPEPLRSTLIEHIQADGTDPMRYRMRHGYRGYSQCTGLQPGGEANL